MNSVDTKWGNGSDGVVNACGGGEIGVVAPQHSTKPSRVPAKTLRPGRKSKLDEAIRNAKPAKRAVLLAPLITATADKPPVPATPSYVSAASSESVAAAETRRKALDLRIQGKSLFDIGKELGIPTQERVARLIDDALTALVRVSSHQAAELRQMELERLDKLLDKIWNKVDTRPQWADAAMKLLERRHKIQGLDITRHEISGPNGNPIQVTVQQFDMSKFSDEELKTWEELMKKGATLPSRSKDVIEGEIIPTPTPTVGVGV